MNCTWKAALSAATLALLAACGGGDDNDSSTSTDTGTTVTTAVSVVMTQDFVKDNLGWVGESSDYTTATAPTGVVFESRDVATLNGVSTYPTGYKALYMAGTNRSDDLLLYVKKQVTGLVANTQYTFAIASLNLLTNAPTGCMGVGGAPGESVYVIAAASTNEPKAVTTNGDTRLNIDHGNQGTAGANSMILGNIANGLPCDGTTKYVSKLVRNYTGVTVTTDANGNAWILLGIDSGYEAATAIYLQNLTLTFVPVTTTT